MTGSHNPSEKVYKSRRQLMIDNFLGGIMWGLGTVIGAGLLVTVIGFVIARTQQLPVIGQYINQIVEQIQVPSKENSDQSN